MEKILIIAYIFQNPLHNRILFILGSAKLGLVVICKSFPFGFSWSSHNNRLSATWPFGPLALCPSTKDPSMLSHFHLGCQVHLSRSVTFRQIRHLQYSPSSISYPKWFILLSKYVEISTYLESNDHLYFKKTERDIFVAFIHCINILWPKTLLCFITQ